jgi:hypothetical protein
MGSFFATAKMLTVTYSLVLDRRTGRALVTVLEAGLNNLRALLDKAPQVASDGLLDQLDAAEQVLDELERICPTPGYGQPSKNLELDLVWPSAA